MKSELFVLNVSYRCPSTPLGLKVVTRVSLCDFVGFVSFPTETMNLILQISSPFCIFVLFSICLKTLFILIHRNIRVSFENDSKASTGCRGRGGQRVTITNEDAQYVFY